MSDLVKAINFAREIEIFLSLIVIIVQFFYE